MKTQGYVVARNHARKEFFTSKSAYDRPQWLPVLEATVYPTPEMAQQAAIKLGARGNFGARIVELSEAISLNTLDDAARGVMPPGDVSLSVTEPDGTDVTDEFAGDESGMEVDIQPDGEGGTEMVAQDQQQPCETCQHDPCTCEDPDDSEAEVDQMVDDQVLGDESSDAELQGAGQLDDLAAELDGRPRMESAQPTAQPIKYKDPATKADKPATDLTTYTAMNHEEKATVPAEVMSDLKRAISDFQSCADLSTGRDDAKGSFCMTVVGAFEELQDILEQGTVQAVKMAQVKVTSWMNPITMHLPVSVQKFIHNGGRKPSLKDMFDAKRGV